MSDLKSETALIQDAFAPLTLGAEGSYGLRDDVAFLPAQAAGLIVTQDQIIEGTHFLPEDPLPMIARRLVRRNLSDLIAKGGIPTAAFLSLAWPKSRPRSGIAEFAQGLGADLYQLCAKCPLMGGDTSETSGHLVASLTMMGTATAKNGQPVLRSGAKVGDVVAVTGVIGDAWLGLQVRHGLFSRWEAPDCYAFSLAPCPPTLGMANLIGQFASAAIDVSDGLIIDAHHLATASGMNLTLALDKVPMSEEAMDFPAFDDPLERAIVLAIGGDDYQPLITLPPDDFKAYQGAAKKLGVRVTRIGTCQAGEGVQLSFKGKPVPMPATMGWQI